MGDMNGIDGTDFFADPASFMIILESNEVHGEGFRTIRIGEGETQAKNSTAKSPMGAFKSFEIDNDMGFVLKALEDF